MLKHLGWVSREKIEDISSEIACNHYEIVPILGDIRTLKDLLQSCHQSNAASHLMTSRFMTS